MKLFCTQIVRIFTLSCPFSLSFYHSIFSTAMYRKIRVILLLYITKIKKYYKTKRGHIKNLTCPRENVICCVLFLLASFFVALIVLFGALCFLVTSLCAFFVLLARLCAIFTIFLFRTICFFATLFCFCTFCFAVIVSRNSGRTCYKSYCHNGSYK